MKMHNSTHRCLFKIIARRFGTNVNIVRATVNPVQIPQIPLHEYLWRNLNRWPQKTALVCFETGRSYTYQDLQKKSLALTKFLKESLKLQRSETVGIVLQNLPEYPLVILGATQAGLGVTTCNPGYTAEEIKTQFLISKPRIVFTSTNLLPSVQQAIQSLGSSIPVVEITPSGNQKSPNTISFNEISSGGGCDPVEVSPEDVAFIPYSSGTTGLPKGVQLSHFNVVANLCQISAPEFELVKYSDTDKQDVVPAFLPFFHIYGLVVVLFNALYHGAKIVTMPNFTSDSFIKLLKTHKPDVVYGVPLVVTMATIHPDIRSEDLACIRSFLSGAAPLGPTDVERFRLKTNNKVNILQGYGMTETSPVTIMQSGVLKHGIKTGGSGLLAPNTEAKIIPIDGSSTNGLGANESGELIVKGPQNMQGYFNNPQANKEIFLEDGWLRTGDIAYYDEDQHFYITDRLKELIKVKGFQVAPAELEEILRDHPGVADAAVTGVPHPVQGEAPKAFVVLKRGEKLKASDLEQYVAGKVAKHKHLVGGVVLLDSIPKSASGKILRRELKKL